MVYKLLKMEGNASLLQPINSSYTEGYAQKMCDLYLTDEIHHDEYGKTKKYYRLHAKNMHNEEMALSYDILCPACGHPLKQVGRVIDYNDLGLYVCRFCDKH